MGALVMSATSSSPAGILGTPLPRLWAICGKTKTQKGSPPTPFVSHRGVLSKNHRVSVTKTNVLPSLSFDQGKRAPVIEATDDDDTGRDS